MPANRDDEIKKFVDKFCNETKELQEVVIDWATKKKISRAQLLAHLTLLTRTLQAVAEGRGEDPAFKRNIVQQAISGIVGLKTSN